MPARRRLPIAVALLSLVACVEVPTEPSALERRFQELMAAPAIEVSPARDSAFHLAHGWWRPLSLGYRTHITQATWAADWNYGIDSASPAFGAPPAVDFETEFVLRANAFGYAWYEIEKLVRVRDTAFLVLQYYEGCNTGLAGAGINVAVRLFPKVEGPARYAIARHIQNCTTGRVRVEYLP